MEQLELSYINGIIVNQFRHLENWFSVSMKTKMQDMDENTYTLSEMKVAHLCSTLLRPHELYSPWNSPGQNTEAGSLSLLQGIFPTQGSKAGRPHCRQILSQLSHKRSPRILEWVAYPFSRGSSRPRNRTRVSCIAGRRFYCLSHQGSLKYSKGYSYS